MADANKKVNINISTKADTSGADKAAKSIQNISTTTTTASSAVVKGSGNMAFAIGNVGNQLQDIAIQAQSGTSAITILSQQGPQLLSGFGPQGAIAGAVLALGGLILSTMIKSTDAAKKAAEDAWTAADEFAQKTADAYKKAGGEDADKFITKAERIRDLVNESANAEIDLASQQRERIKAQGDLIKSQEDLAIASIKYLEATGQITDAESRIVEIQKQARAAQKETAIADIQASTSAAEIRYKTAQTLLSDAEEQKTRLQESINQLQIQQQTINRQANIARASDKGMVEAGLQKPGYQSTATSQLENQLAKLEGSIAELQKQSDKAPEQVQKAIDNVYSTAQAFDTAQKGAAAQIQELEAKYNITESTQALNQGVTAITEGVKTLKEDVDKIQPVTQQQIEAKNTIQSALADGKLTADELLKVGAALQVLMATLKSGQEGNASIIREMQATQLALINSNNALVAEANRQAGLIKSLRTVAN